MSVPKGDPSAETITDGELPASARTRYADLLDRLLEARQAGTLTDAQEDGLLERLDLLWWAMSEPERLSIDRRVANGRPKYVVSEPFGEALPEGYQLEEEGGRVRALAPGRSVAWFGAWRRGQRGPARAVGDAWVHATGARRAHTPA